jgi:hypothetical protein
LDKTRDDGLCQQRRQSGINTLNFAQKQKGQEWRYASLLPLFVYLECSGGLEDAIAATPLPCFTI